jgi:hypothetical protein
MKTKIVLSLITGAILFSGCASDSLDELKITTVTPDIPKIKTHSVKEYKNMSFKQFAKNVYAKEMRKYSNKYEVNCRTISLDNNLTKSNYLCVAVDLNNETVMRPLFIQKEVNIQLAKKIETIKNELNKFCIAKGGFIENTTPNNVCKKGNKILFGYKEVSDYHSPAFQFFMPKIKKSIVSILKSHGAIELSKNKFDVSKIIKNQRVLCNIFNGCGTDIYPLLASKYSTSKLEAIQPDRFLCENDLDGANPVENKIRAILTQDELKNNVKYLSKEIVIYLFNKKLIAVLNPQTKHLFLVDDSMRKKINSIIKMAKMKKQIKKDLKENLDY